MRGDELLEKMELIDPAFVTAADEASKKHRGAWVKWSAIAACLCAVAAIAFAALRPDNQSPGASAHLATVAATTEATTTPTEEEKATEATTASKPDSVRLEAITIPDLYAGFGYEGFCVYDISEYRNGNPWSPEMELTTLPVYRNGAYDASRLGLPLGLTEEEMKARLAQYAAAFGLNILSTETNWEEVYVQRNSPQTERKALWIEAQTDGGVLRAAASGSVTYEPSKEQATLPEGYRFTNSSTTDEEAGKTLAYLTERYSGALGFAQPVPITAGDYNFFGVFDREYGVYDGAGTAAEVILNYNFRSARFVPDENFDDVPERNEAGGLRYVSVSDGLLSAEKLGDYPIISADEAMELLLSGHGQTSVSPDYSAPTAETVEHVELVYRTGAMEEILLPYYRFDVRLPDDPDCGAELGLKNYGVYYVPAVAAEYLTDMPTYDGWFIG